MSKTNEGVVWYLNQIPSHKNLEKWEFWDWKSGMRVRVDCLLTLEWESRMRIKNPIYMFFFLFWIESELF